MVSMNDNPNTFFPLAGVSVVSFEGADTVSFLQGQLSADVAQLPADEWRRAAYCSPKGRALATMFLLRRGDGVVALMSSDLAEQTAAALKRFVLRAKVNITLPECAVEYSPAHDDSSPSTVESGAVKEEGESLLIDEGGGMFLRVCFNSPPQPAEDGGATWRRMQIQRGVPWINTSNTGMFIPQYFNWELLGGINFQKGCYVGQEIIARLHYLGNIKRRGYVISGAGSPPAAGVKIGSAETVNAEADDSDGFVAFVSAPRDIGESVEWEGRTINIKEPSYGLPTAEEDNKPRPKV